MHSSWVNTKTTLPAGWPKILGSSTGRDKLESFHTASVVQPAYVMRIGAFSRGLKRPRRKADYGEPYAHLA
jgi:hypothetical protein